MKVVDGADGRLLRLDEVAQSLSISKSMAWKLVAHGQVRSLKIGRSIRVRKSDVEDYLTRATRDA